MLEILSDWARLRHSLLIGLLYAALREMHRWHPILGSDGDGIVELWVERL